MTTTCHQLRAAFVSLLLISPALGAQTPDPALSNNTPGFEDDLISSCFNSLQQDPVTPAACERAIEWVSDELARSPSDRPFDTTTQAQLHSALAVQWARLGDPGRAAAAVAQASRLAPDDAVVIGNEATTLMYNGDFQGALALLDRAIALSPPAHLMPNLLLNRSLTLRALGRFDLAAMDYRAFLDWR